MGVGDEQVLILVYCDSAGAVQLGAGARTSVAAKSQASRSHHRGDRAGEPVHPPNPAKAPWYFLALQELVAYSAFVGGVLVPGLVVAVLFALPFVDRGRVGVGRWFARERWLANTIFVVVLLVFVVLTVVSTYFRGPNWDFVLPWAETLAPHGG